MIIDDIVRKMDANTKLIFLYLLAAAPPRKYTSWVESNGKNIQVMLAAGQIVIKGGWIQDILSIGTEDAKASFRYLIDNKLIKAERVSDYAIVSIMKKKMPASMGKDCSRKFDLFWAKYPSGENKMAAKEAFMAINPNDDLFSEIMAGLDRYIKVLEVRSRLGDGRVCICHASTWLRKSRWQDEQKKSLNSGKGKLNTFDGKGGTNIGGAKEI